MRIVFNKAQLDRVNFQLPSGARVNLETFLIKENILFPSPDFLRPFATLVCMLATAETLTLAFELPAISSLEDFRSEAMNVDFGASLLPSDLADKSCRIYVAPDILLLADMCCLIGNQANEPTASNVITMNFDKLQIDAPDFKKFSQYLTWRYKLLAPKRRIKTPFDLKAKGRASITLPDLLERIHTYMQGTPILFFQTLVYLERYADNQRLELDDTNIFKLFSIAFLVAYKYYEDDLFKGINDHAAKVFGVELQEANELEYIFLSSIDGDLYVSPADVLFMVNNYRQYAGLEIIRGMLKITELSAQSAIVQNPPVSTSEKNVLPEEDVFSKEGFASLAEGLPRVAAPPLTPSPTTAPEVNIEEPVSRLSPRPS